MSSLMAFSLTNLADWTTWILLALLACWDLIAVLCPFGPLKLLVEHSDSNKQMIPKALIYSTMVWMMAQDVRIKINDNSYETHELTHIPSTQFDEGEASSTCSTKELINSKQRLKGKMMADDNCKVEINDDAESDISNNQDNSINRDCNGNLDSDSIEAQSLTNKTLNDHRNNPKNKNDNSNDHQNNNHRDDEDEDVDDTNSNRNRRHNENGEDDEDEEGLKLGLGDFVFYSVLISRAAMYDWITTFSCVIAVLTGLTLTIFLLSIYQKALPALPISIVLGIIFYVVSSSLLGSLMKYLTRIPVVEANVNSYSGLKIKMENGCGFVYL